MPVYFAEGQAARELEQFDSDVLMIQQTLQRFQEAYPYVSIDCFMEVDVVKRDQVLKQRYTYGINIHY